jgi:hypothetical protein
MGLTTKQRLFVSYYLGQAAGNGTEAARMAGYAFPGRAAAKLVVKSCIRAAIDAKLAAVALTADQVLAHISEIADSALGEYIKDDGSVDVARVRRGRRSRVVRKIKTYRKTYSDREGSPVEETRSELELYDRLEALDKLARYHGLYKKDQAPTVDLAELLDATDQRALEHDQGAAEGSPDPQP